jgi:hypothetical protein
MESDSIDGQSVASVSDEHSSVDGGVERGRKRKYNKGVQAEITKHGPLTLFIIIGMLGGLWQVQFGNVYGDMWDEFEDGRMRVFGVVLGRWEFIHVADCKPDDDWSVLRKSAKALSRMQIVGYLKYNIIDRIELNDHFETASMSARLLIRSMSVLIVCKTMPNEAIRGNALLKETLTKWNLEHGVPKICNSVLCNSLAHSATTEDNTYFHVVACGRRAPHRSRIFEWPSVAECRQLISRALADVRSGGVHPDSVPRRLAHPANIMIRWIDSTRTLAKLKNAHKAKTSWIALFSIGAPETKEEMEARIRTVNAETLRLARVRIDLVAMLVFRLFFATLTFVNVYLYADTSPQWRGTELMAASFDMTANEITGIQHRLFPLVIIGRSMLSAVGKCITLLWQIFLMVGPNFYRMRAFLLAVRSITTDLGTERLLAKQPDILIPFFKWIKGYVPKGSKPGLFLFPRALVAVGWNHLVDGLVNRGLCSLPWFPCVLDSIKAINRFPA